MYCSRCAIEIASGSDFCSKCGQQVGASGSVKPQKPVVRSGFIVVLLLILAVLGAFVYFAARQERAGDTANIAAAIRSDYEKRGFTVEQVSMIRESNTRLSGFVKFRKSTGLLSKVQLTKNCVATQDVDTSQFIWECK
jgi:hypothetical protein